MYSQIKQCLPFCSNSVKMKKSIAVLLYIALIESLKSGKVTQKSTSTDCTDSRPTSPFQVLKSLTHLQQYTASGPWLRERQMQPSPGFQRAQDWACVSTAPFEHLLLPCWSPFRKHLSKIQWFFSFFFPCVFASLFFFFWFSFLFCKGRDKGWGGWCGSQN